MLLIRGRAAGTELTGTLYEPGEHPPSYQGAPNAEAQYTWVCDEFYEVADGGRVQEVDGREVQVAFEDPLPRGFDDRDRAIEAAREHLRTQFGRLGVAADEVEVALERVEQSA
ncbi:MAG: hypothetical protein V5A43_10980 [Haloarculaceae archaeon]